MRKRDYLEGKSIQVEHDFLGEAVRKREWSRGEEVGDDTRKSK
jgi:hypothetical protein